MAVNVVSAYGKLHIFGDFNDVFGDKDVNLASSIGSNDIGFDETFFILLVKGVLEQRGVSRVQTSASFVTQ